MIEAGTELMYASWTELLYEAGTELMHRTLSLVSYKILMHLSKFY